MQGVLIDTNVFLRIMTEDIPDQAAQAKKLFEKIINKDIRAYTTTAVIFEIAWVLDAYYELSRQEIGEKLALIMNTPNLKIADVEVIEETLIFFNNSKADFIDCFNAAFAKLKSESSVVSFDKHFDKFPGIKKYEPKELV